jgi:hypothetical protein
MNFVEYFNIYGVDAQQIPSITGDGAPTSKTEGAVGCLYMNTANGDLYKCTAATSGNYTWTAVGSGGTGTVKKVSGNAPDVNGNVTLPSLTINGQAYNGSSAVKVQVTAGNDYTHPATHPASMITDLATVATSGSYNDLTDRPDLATVAKSGSYNDLSDKPIIPTVPTTLKNPKAMTINGQTYDGSTAVNFTEKINALIDAKLAAFSNAEGVSF